MRRAKGLVLVIALVMAGPAARAELVQVDAVGVAPAGPDARQAALESGLREAVLLAAEELVREAGTSADRPALEAALGADLRGYAARYRLSEDRGERPAQLVQEPGVEREYAVVVEAQVEQGRVQEALRRAGLLGVAAPGGVRSLWLTVEGVDTWPTWDRLRRALAARGGAVRPIEFARGVVVAEMQTDESNDALIERLRRAVGDSLGLSVTGSAPGTLRIRVVTAAAPALDVPASAPPSEPAAPVSP